MPSILAPRCQLLKCAPLCRGLQAAVAAVAAVSFSACLDGQLVMAYLQTLKRALPAGCALWLGGQGCVDLSNDLRQGCAVFVDTPSAVLGWQQMGSAALASICMMTTLVSKL
ncbi:MAG TPA: hypothetical protein PLB25_06190 [Rhodoferax sp.]|nr:hypothetical protein [Rhodoferax sp.]